MLKKIFTAFFMLLVCHAYGRKQSTLNVASIFQDNMVIQQGIKAPVWGITSSGSKIIVEFAGTRTTAVADSSGKWMLRMPVLKAGGPYTMKVSGKNVIVFHNVMIGEVWLAAGQSNMELTLPAVNNATEEISRANYPGIRFFTVGLNVANKPLTDVTGQWRICSPETAPALSAVAYFFGRSLQNAKNVPVGLMIASWGGTIGEAFLSADMLYTHPDFKSKIIDLRNMKTDWNTIFHTYESQMADYRKSDEGFKAGANKIAYNDSLWKTTNYPASTTALGLDKTYASITWFRKIFAVQHTDTTQWMLSLGKIDGNPTVYINGQKLETQLSYIDGVKYAVPAGLLNNGNNLLVVKWLNMWGGSFGSKDFVPAIYTEKYKTELAGMWKYNSSLEPPVPPYVSSNSTPSTIFNGMIAPLIPYGIKGVLWYQGESNTARAYQYRSLLPMLITDWRNKWQQGNFPFLFVQLANFQPIKKEPSQSEWAELREAQSMALKVNNTGMAVTIDIGDANNIHPTNKQDVGKRLFLAAQHVAYNEKVVNAGPVYNSMAINGNTIRVRFLNATGGLKLAGSSKNKGFAIAGADMKFYWANARIDGEDLILSCDSVGAPVAVRYNWADTPEGFLYNPANFPAVPFRTDDWPIITTDKK